jgi:hypothetical protein
VNVDDYWTRRAIEGLLNVEPEGWHSSVNLEFLVMHKADVVRSKTRNVLRQLVEDGFIDDCEIQHRESALICYDLDHEKIRQVLVV